jgi:hypothetical protein
MRKARQRVVDLKAAQGATLQLLLLVPHRQKPKMAQMPPLFSSQRSHLL